MQPIVLAGLDKDVIWLIKKSNQYNLIGFFDKNPDASDVDVPNLGNDATWPEWKRKYPDLQVVIVIDPADLKRKLAQHYGLENLATLIGSDVMIDDSAHIGKGTIIQAGCLVSRNAHVGIGCKLNIRAMLHHDVMLGDFSTVAPAAQLLGKVSVGKGCFIGAGAIILPNLTIGENVVIGAGSVVTKHISAYQTVCGVPARILKKQGI